MLFNPTNPAEALQSPGLNTILYWLIAVLLLLVLGGAIAWAWVRWRRHSHGVDADPRRLAGTASSHEVAISASTKALLRRAATLRPSLDQPEPEDVGYLLGRSHGKQVWASVEDSILLIGPPRSGKGLHIVIPAILDAPGAVVTTSTRPDNLTATMRARERMNRPRFCAAPMRVSAPGGVMFRGQRSTRPRTRRVGRRRWSSGVVWRCTSRPIQW